jgi:hypothetical protein
LIQFQVELADEEKDALNGAKAYFASKREAQLLNNVESMRKITESSQAKCDYTIDSPDIDTPEKMCRKQHRRFKRKLTTLEAELFGSDSDGSDKEPCDVDNE